jgi:hypothetical protein
MDGVGVETAVSNEVQMTTATYEIKIKGYLDQQWSEWLGDLEFAHDDKGNTLLSGPIADQAALHGILAQIRDLGLPLISLIPQNIIEDDS